jgi:undecaprenyl diphosphate synthase
MLINFFVLPQFMFFKEKIEIKHAGIIIDSDDEADFGRPHFELVDELVKSQISNNMIMFTLCLPKNINSDDAKNYFRFILDSGFCKNNSIKVNVVGKWYDLKQELVETIKEVMSETKDYDTFFLNFCINYDGQQEIVDACKVMGMKVKAGKVDPEIITKEDIKENLSTSGFLPPALIIKTGIKRKLRGFLLWDCINARIYFTEKPFLDFNVKQFEKILRD